MDINGIKIDVVPIVGLLNYFEKHIIAQYRTDVESVSKDLKFILSALKDAPRGDELREKMDAYRLSVDGMIETVKYSINYHNKDIDVNKIQELFDKLDTEHLTELIKTIYGIKDIEDKKKLI